MIIVFHATAWLLLFSLPALLRPSYHPPVERPLQPPNDLVHFILIHLNDAFLVSFFYLNILLIIPFLLYKKRYIAYTLTTSAYFGMSLLVMWLLQINLNEPGFYFSFNKFLLFNIFSFLFIVACSMAYKLGRDKISTERLVNDAVTNELKTEVSLLRSQVSPHLILNALNNMVSLSRKRSDQLEPLLIKLSSLMRYMLYEKDVEKVSLEKETEFLQNYIAFQQQRLGQEAVINATIYQSDKKYDIEPMLLIPFVENAFAQGTGRIHKAYIDIEMKAERDILFFSVTNSYDPGSPEKINGMNFSGVKKRLELLYPGKHTLNVKRDDRLLTGMLTINLN
ncbi:MAG: histidine kinase [Ferruginibacter sp.]